MATPLPTDGDVYRSVPHGEETVLVVRGLPSAPGPTNGLTGLQAALLRAIVQAMLGLDVDLHALESVEPDVFAGRWPTATACSAPGSSSRWVCSTWCSSRWTRRRPDGSRPSPRSRASRDVCVHKFAALAEGSLKLAASRLRPQPISQPPRDRRTARRLRPPSRDATHRAWTTPVVGDVVAAGWRSLGHLPSNTIGRHVHHFYVLRGFAFRHAGLRATAARQHDWVHVLADYGTVEAEIEVFGVIARASDAPDVFAPRLDELRRDLGVPPTSPENDCGRQRPALASRWQSHAQRAAAAGGRVPTGTMSPRASEAGTMTANPCDPTATAQEEGR